MNETITLHQAASLTGNADTSNNPLSSFVLNSLREFDFRVETEVQKLVNLGIPISQLCLVTGDILSGSPPLNIQQKAIKHFQLTALSLVITEVWICFKKDVDPTLTP